MKFWEWIFVMHEYWKQDRERLRRQRWRTVRDIEAIHVVVLEKTLFIDTEPSVFRSNDGKIFNSIMCDIIYALLKGRHVLGKSFEDMDLSQFDNLYEIINFDIALGTCLIGKDKKNKMLLTNDFNKRLVADLVFETQAMEYEDSVKLFVIEKDVFDRLKSGMLAAEECIEQENYDFYIGSGADHYYFMVYRPSHEYGDIVETIKEVMAPYGLAVNYAEAKPEKENGEGKK